MSATKPPFLRPAPWLALLLTGLAGLALVVVSEVRPPRPAAPPEPGPDAPPAGPRMGVLPEDPRPEPVAAADPAPRRSVPEARAAEVEELLSGLLGPRWPSVRASLGPVRLAALASADLAGLPAWAEVEHEVYLAGQLWIDERRGTWPGGLSDRWRDVDHLDFRRSAFNRQGLPVDEALEERLRAIVSEYNADIDRLARRFWDEVALAYDAGWQPATIVPLPDPAGPGRDQAGLELLGVPGETPGLLLEVVAADEGWRVELPLTPQDAPDAAALLETIRALEHERLQRVRETIEGS